MEIRFSSSARKEAILRNKSPLPEKLKVNLSLSFPDYLRFN